MKRQNFVNPRRAPSADSRTVYGPHAVMAWIHTQPTVVRTVYYHRANSGRLTDVLGAAAAARIHVQPAEQDQLTTLAGTPRHQGVVATVLPFPYTPFETVIARLPELLILGDQIQDPHNLGAVLRTAVAAGVGAVIVPKDGSVAVTPAVEAVAAGAAAMIPVCRVTNAARTLRALKGAGYWIAGLAPRLGTGLFEFAPPKPLTIVLGGEQGMRPLLARQCEVLVSIPMWGAIESLNASVALAVALFHVRRQWQA